MDKLSFETAADLLSPSFAILNSLVRGNSWSMYVYSRGLALLREEKGWGCGNSRGLMKRKVFELKVSRVERERDGFALTLCKYSLTDENFILFLDMIKALSTISNSYINCISPR